MLASTQRDYIAGEVSRDLTKRLLLPEKFQKQMKKGFYIFMMQITLFNQFLTVV